MSKSRDTVENLRTVLVAGDVTNANFTGADLDIAKGGTGSSTAGAARTALGLDIGSDVLAPNGDGSNLTGINAVEVGSTLPSDGAAAGSLFYLTSDLNFYVSDGTTWGLVANLSPLPTGGTVVIPNVLESSGSYSYNLGIDFTDSIDPDSALTYTLVSGSLPTGAVLPTSGNTSFTGTIPAVSSNTTFNFVIRATDTGGRSSTQSYQQTIQNAQPIPTGGTVTLTTFVEGSSVSYDVDANFTYPTGSTFSAYSVASGALPAGLSLNTSTGVISGTGADISSNTTYSFSIRATDTASLTGDQAYSWTSEITPPLTATGGTVVHSSGYKMHTFTSSGTFAVTVGGDVEVMILSGGGGGNGDMGAGGGGGGVRYKNNHPITSGNYSIVVGAGGASGPVGVLTAANSGGNSSAFGVVAEGGLGGTSTTGGVSGAYTGTSNGFTTHGGFNGGGDTSGHGGGGGGGANANGINCVTNATLPSGGAGHANTINDNVSYYWGGGGGGGTYRIAHGGPSGNGGLGGGGAGACSVSANAGAGGGAGINNGGYGGSGTGGNGGSGTGGGGGGGTHNTAGGNGGSGIVIVRYVA